MDRSLADRENAPKPSRARWRSFHTFTVSALPFANSCAFSARMAGGEQVAGQVADGADRVAGRRDDLGLAGCHARAGDFVLLHEDLQPREDAVRALAWVLAEADELVAGEDGTLDSGRDMPGKRG